jgi:hypothetical protein
MNRLLNASVASIAMSAVVLGGGCGKHDTAPPPSAAPPAQAAVPPPAPPAYAYYYYPDVEVYYYPVTGVYWWFDGAVWISGPRPPPTILLRDSVRVSVNLNTAEPWRQHDVVIREHPRGR